MIWKIIGVLFGGFLSGEGATKAAGAVNGLAFYGAIAGAVYWLLNDGRAWTVTLNGLELSGLVALGAILLEAWRRMPPPSPGRWGP